MAWLCDNCGEYYTDSDLRHESAPLEPLQPYQRAYPIVPVETKPPPAWKLRLMDGEPTLRELAERGREPKDEQLNLLWFSMGALELGVRANLALAWEQVQGPTFPDVLDYATHYWHEVA